MSFRSKAVRVSVSLGLIFAASTTLSAAPITDIDQQNLVGGSTNSASFTGAGQSFIPLFDRIDAAEFSFNTPSATLRLDVFDGSGIGGTLLGSSAAIAVVTSGFEIVHFDLLTPVSLTPGNTYTLFVSALSGTFGQQFDVGDPYAGGFAFDQGGFAASNVDLVFTEGLTVPEPSALWLSGTGFLGVLMFGLRRRVRRQTL
jgi:hypothetical protein